MFLEIVPMFVAKDFARRRADILRDEAISNNFLLYEHWNYPEEHVYQF